MEPHDDRGGDGRRRDSWPVALVRLGRPLNQWRNLMVLVPAVLMLAGWSGSGGWKLVALFATWCVASAATYAFNDAFDLAGDRTAVLRPDRKTGVRPTEGSRSRRPLIRGDRLPAEVKAGARPPTEDDWYPDLTPGRAVSIGRGEMVVAGVLAAALVVSGAAVPALIVVGYGVANLGRSRWVDRPPPRFVPRSSKRASDEPWLRRSGWIDLLIVSAGFLARVASGVPLLSGPRPPIALYVTVFGAAVVISAAKRRRKDYEAGIEGNDRRLQRTIVVCTAVSVVAFPVTGWAIHDDRSHVAIMAMATTAYAVMMAAFATAPEVWLDPTLALTKNEIRIPAAVLVVALVCWLVV